MREYVGKRIAFSVFVLLLGSIITFSLLHLPGNEDPAAKIAPPTAGPATVEKIRLDLGLDKPPHIRYFEWLGGVLHGDFGESFVYKRPVSTMIAERLPQTLKLVAFAVTISLIVGLPVGVLISGGSKIARLVSMGGWLLAVSVPILWIGILVISIFGVWFGWQPGLGQGVGLEYIILPGLSLAVVQTAFIARAVKSDIVDSRNKIKVHERKRESISHRIVRAVTVITPRRLPLLFGVAVVIERVFGWPGMGSLMVTSIFNEEFLVIQGILLVFIVLTVILNLVGDILYAYYKSRFVKG